MTYTLDQLASFPWIVSTATLRTQDLIASYWAAAAQIGVSLSPVIQALEQLEASLDLEDWSEDLAAQTLEELTEMLEASAPAGFSFGSHEGDGACFGFWLADDWSDALETLGVDSEDPAIVAELIARLEDDGLNPESIEDAYQGRADGWTEDRAGADYAQQLAEDIGEASELATRWPYTCIDWANAWEELRLGDGYRLCDIGGDNWLVFRSV